MELSWLTDAVRTAIGQVRHSPTRASGAQQSPWKMPCTWARGILQEHLATSAASPVPTLNRGSRAGALLRGRCQRRTPRSRPSSPAGRGSSRTRTSPTRTRHPSCSQSSTRRGRRSRHTPSRSRRSRTRLVSSARGGSEMAPRAKGAGAGAVQTAATGTL
jgi:hypothetical protein